MPTGSRRWIFSTKPPLFWELVSDHTIETKLTNMKTALVKGADPNELDHEARPERNLGRPLHLATDYTLPDISRLHENIVLVKLLLENGADPRLAGMRWRLSPIEELRSVVAYGDPSFREVIGFLKEALELMETKAKELGERDAEKGTSKRVRCIVL